MENHNSKLAGDGIVLFVDHQHGIAERARTSERKDVDLAAAKLAKLARTYGMPVVVSAIAMSGPPKITSELKDALGDDVAVLVRNGTDSLDEPAIADAIEKTGRKTLLIAGIVTEVAVQRPALSGLTRGFRTQVVLDACNGAGERSENAAVARMTQAGVEMTSVPTIIGELAADFADPRVKQVLPLLMS